MSLPHVRLCGRTGPRDRYGRAFGLDRARDNVGAVLGPSWPPAPSPNPVRVSLSVAMEPARIQPSELPHRLMVPTP